MSLTSEEMKQGIIRLHCYHCGDTTRHQTITRKEESYFIKGKRTIVKKGTPICLHDHKFNHHGVCSHLRKCLKCGNIVDF